jgi:3-dehydroquinate synthase
VLVVEPGERSKSLETAATLYDQLADAKIARDDVIVAFGGGVVGDLGGFVAATWLRGVRCVQVPTTLLAAVDASVGGKTGLNHTQGKNLIGVFQQPAAVVIDPDLLSTLPAREYSAGLAESVKHAAIRDPALLAWQEDQHAEILARDGIALERLIARNCEIKAEIVARDEREAGVRAILNYGHTLGHAIEHVLGYELRHGECVALGIVAENELARARGQLRRDVAERIRTLLETFALPVRLPRAVDPDGILAACRMDKKTRSEAVNFILLRDVGDPCRVADVSDAEIVAALAAVAPE